MRVKLYACVWLLFLSQLAVAQTTPISGKVTDGQSGEPLPGVNVRVKNEGGGAVTNLDGTFRLEASSEDTLQFSYVGYLTEEFRVGNQTNIEVSLMPDLKTLSEVVVVGYGEQKKSLVTGAISSVKAEEIATVSSTRVEEALQGRTAGVNVLPSSGSPGSPMQIRIRGTGSNRDNEPLYIVDGVRAGGIEYLAPSEIESVEVLKDAASAAIYGAEAANGVVIITTKTGTPGAGEISYSGQYGVQSVRNNLMELMNARQYQEYLEEAGATPRPAPSDVVDEEGTDWFEEIFEVAPQQSHALNFSGGSEKSTYLIGGTYFKQEGIVGGDKSRFDRFTVRLNTDHKIKPWLNIGERLSYSYFNRNALAENDEFGGLINSALALDPLTPVRYTDPTAYPDHLLAAINGTTPGGTPIGPLLAMDENGNYYGISNYVRGEFGNPLARIENTKGGLNQNKVVGNIYADIMPVEGLKFTTRFGIDAAFQREHYWTPTSWYSSESLTTVPTGADHQNTWFSWQWENFANYSRQIGVHDFSVLLGTSAIENQWTYVGGTFSELFKESDLFSYAQFAPDTRDRISSNANSTRLLSYFGRVSYSYQEKYLFNGTLRRDGASVLAEGNKWGTFPSASVGWNIHNEDFYSASGASNIMNSFKLRASWGQNGNLGPITIGEWMSTIAAIQPGYFDAEGNYLVSAAAQTLSNPDLRWETSEQLDIGADIYFFNNRLSLVADYFIKTTRDLLTPALSFGPSGNNLPVINGGTVENRGWEFELAYRSQAGSALQYEVAANFTALKNEVTFLDETVGEVPGAGVGTGWEATYFSLGYPIYYFRGYKTAGIFQNQEQIDAYREANNISPDNYNPSPGDPIVVDTNNDEKISPEDQTFIGNPHPDFIFGTRVNLAYKGFDFLVFLQGQIGNDVLMGFNRIDRPTANRPEFFYTNRWTGEGSTDDWFAANTTSVYAYNSDLMVFDGSYARVRQLQLGYTLPRAVLSSADFKNLRVYATLDNYFTFTNYPGMDPEVGQGNSVGIDRGAYPIPRKTMLGLQFNF